MQMKFTKMQGLGNDFVVIDAVTQNVRISASMVRRLSNRTLGIGCDQVLETLTTAFLIKAAMRSNSAAMARAAWLAMSLICS